MIRTEAKLNGLSTPAGRNETGLLLCCARTAKDPGTAGRIAALLRADIDWEYLLRLANRHGMVPLLHWHLNGDRPEAVPDEVLGRLRSHFNATHLRNLYLTGELLKLLRELEARGIPAIPYKGPVLAATAYGNLALRQFGDLDVLVRERDVLEAGEALASLGYRAQHGLSPGREAAFLPYARQYLFRRDDGSAVELHWKITSRHTSFPLTPEYLLEHAERVPLGGSSIPAFPREDLILTLCVHGSLHRWERLKWICDVGELVRASGSVDWDRIVRRAGELRSNRMLFLGLALVNDLLDTELPEDIMREVRSDPVVEELAAEVSEQLFSGSLADREGIVEQLPYWRFQFRLQERPRDRFRYCIHRAMTPALPDRQAMPLPGALFPLYRLIRPLRLGGRLLRELAARLPPVRATDTLRKKTVSNGEARLRAGGSTR
ncbi:hypothetical protein E0L93_12910 [Rubrobacter taiwanensis]|jgi:hypothetical protein|uniref:Nucleotidyltransferase family protein n=1 Tax=Rubrobacter taiwanensis TaxID=185139 RepID=A0A4V2NW07_9ACTN|nr:nucleotidyltransferase family protein [Rubrobacter taiwanensis]TCJ15482.1 hypothetical protein E0L93_12910 [Rubrobacter taiwanensis]